MVVSFISIDVHAAILSLDCQPFGYRLATSCEDTTIRLWDISLFMPLLSPNPYAADLFFERIRSENRLPSALAATSDMVVHPLAKLLHHSAAVNVVRWSPCGTLLASGGADGIVAIWQILVTGGIENEKWSVAREHHFHLADVLDVAWSPDLEHIASCSVDNKLIVFNIRTLFNFTISLTEIVKGLAWDPLNELLSGERDNGAGVIVWKILKNDDKIWLEAVKEVKESYENYTLPTQFRRFK